MNEQLQQFISQVASSARGLRVLTALVEDLLASSCGGLGAKLAEYAPRGPDGAPSLIAELRMALRVSAAVGLPVQLQAGAESDLRVRLPSGVDLTIEVEHKSASSAYGAVFHPEPDVLAEYATSQVRWKQEAWRLHEALQTSPFNVQPWGLALHLANPAGVGRIDISRKSVVAGLLSGLSANFGAFHGGNPPS